MPLEFSEDNVTWVAYNFTGAAGALGSESIKLRNWLLHFGCASEEFRAVVADLSDWMANSSPPWDAYRAMMVCCVVALDKIPGVRPVGIVETLFCSISKLVM